MSELLIYRTHICWFLLKKAKHVFAETQLALCPKKLLRKYAEIANIPSPSDKFIFRQITHRKSDFSLTL